MSGIDEHDIRSFLDAIGAFFLQTTREKVEIESAYLLKAGVSAPTFELTSYIGLSGNFSGRIYFSAPRAMVSHLLLLTGEPERKEERLLDAVGEIANIISGNVRRHFGETMKISLPVARTTDSDWLNQAASPGSYVILVKWQQYRASVVVDIRRAG
jgi:chemotaxis protein CheX